jgi:hypothetical protein
MATLVDTAAPGPALAVSRVLPTTAPTNGFWTDAGTQLTDNALHQVNSISLAAGKWCVIAELVGSGNTGDTVVAVLSAASASATPIAPPVQVGTGNAGTAAMLVACVVQLAATTTIFLNVSDSNGVTHTPTFFTALKAVRIG